MHESDQLDQIEAECSHVKLDALDAARKFLRFRWAIHADADGGISFERHDSGFDMVLTFHGDGQPEIYAQVAAVWTQAELDDVKLRAAERMARLRERGVLPPSTNAVDPVPGIAQRCDARQKIRRLFRRIILTMNNLPPSGDPT